VDKNPVNPIDMMYIISNILQTYPSKRYSLILWSHGTGWLPPNSPLLYLKRSNPSVELKSFGSSNNTEMSIADLLSGIPDKVFETLIFDACHMGCIEVAYELKHKANYIIASPSEILAEGFPYKYIIPKFYERNVDPTILGKCFFEYYNQKSGAYRSATIGVIKTSEIDSLAKITKKYLEQCSPIIYSFDNLNVQYYDRYNSHVFYDFKETVDFLCKNTIDLSLFYNQLNKTILYSASTDYFVNEFAILNCSGISCYIADERYNNEYLKYYKTMKWYLNSGFNLVF
jgi:hypothetical protein